VIFLELLLFFFLNFLNIFSNDCKLPAEYEEILQNVKNILTTVDLSDYEDKEASHPIKVFLKKLGKS
jgi:hypothetical protein